MEAAINDLSVQSLTDAEKELRDRYVKEYLVDFNYADAAIRIGYSKDMALIWAARFKYEPYVQNKVTEALLEEPDDPAAYSIAQQRRIKNSLFREANYRGTNSTHGSRVSALGKLADIYGMNAPIKSQVTHDGGQELLVKNQFDFSTLDDKERVLLRKLLEGQVDE